MEWAPKDPDATRRYTVDWSEIYPDTIDSFTLTRTAGTATIGETDNDPRTVFALISGGADGETSTFLHRITTAGGQVLEKTITLRIASDADSLSPVSGVTKGELVIRALSELGIANYIFDIEVEEDVAALKRLDSMMAELQRDLSDMGYARPATTGGSLPGDVAGIDEAIEEAVATNLAIRIAPSYGKTPSPETRRSAANGRSRIYTMYERRLEMEMPSYLPTGAGSRLGRRYFPRQV